MPFLAEAMRAYEEGLGTADDIDTGREGRPEPPDGPARARRLHRPRRLPRGHARSCTRASGRSTSRRRRSSGARRGRPPRPEDGPRLPHLPAPAERAAGSVAGARAGRPAAVRTERSRVDRRDVERLGQQLDAARLANSRSSGFRTSPLMNANRRPSAGPIAATAAWNSMPVMPAIRWSHRIASGGRGPDDLEGLGAGRGQDRLVAGAATGRGRGSRGSRARRRGPGRERADRRPVPAASGAGHRGRRPVAALGRGRPAPIRGSSGRALGAPPAARSRTSRRRSAFGSWRIVPPWAATIPNETDSPRPGPRARRLGRHERHEQAIEDRPAGCPGRRRRPRSGRSARRRPASMRGRADRDPARPACVVGSPGRRSRSG